VGGLAIGAAGGGAAGERGGVALGFGDVARGGGGGERGGGGGESGGGGGGADAFDGGCTGAATIVGSALDCDAGTEALLAGDGRRSTDFSALAAIRSFQSVSQFATARRPSIT
jgi:hypothetical protein